MATLDSTAVFDRFYEAAALPDLWPEALDGFSRMMGARGAMITSPAHTDLFHSPGIAESVAAFFEGGWESRHTRTTAAVRRGSRSFTCDQHIISPDALGRSDYYNGLAIPADVPWFAACGLGDPGEPRVGLSLQRTARQGAFSNDEVRRLDSYLPRLKHIRSIACRLAAGENRRLIDAFGVSGDPVILLGHDGVELDCNAAANALFGDGLVRGAGGEVGATDLAAHIRLRRLIEAASASTECPTQTVRIPRRTGGSLTVQASPVVGRARDLFGKARIFLTVSCPGESTGQDQASLRDRFGLTPTEGRVAGLLLQGKSVAGIAAALDISSGAVRFHLKSILPKAGVRRQAEFVAKAIDAVG